MFETTSQVVLAFGEVEEAAQVFLAIAIVVIVARLVGALFKKIRQPPVVGEILAGILLGPSLLGLFGPEQFDLLATDPTETLFPTEIRPILSIIGKLGLIFFMFIVGLELDVALIKGKERLAAVVSGCSVLLPFVLGVILATAIFTDYSPPGDVDKTAFCLFIGASMSVTAFPVLARILTDRGMYRTGVGALALACAAVDDILAWSLLAVVLSFLGEGGTTDIFGTLGVALLFVAFMFLVVKPQLAKVAAKYREVGRLTPNLLSVFVVGILLSSYATAWIGVHEIFGAFVFGVIMPREDTNAMFHEILEKIESFSALILLPVFFIITGLKVDIWGLGVSDLPVLALILVVACTGKFLGAWLAARAQGVPGPQAKAIGVLMNTRGLTELVILQIGLDNNVLNPELFTMLVIMAILTTVITEPALRLVYPERVLERDIAEAERTAAGIEEAYRVVVLVDDLDDRVRADAMVDLAVGLIDGESPAEIVLTHFEPPSKKVEVGSGLTDELLDLTSSFDTLHELKARAEAAGVPTTIRSQYSDAPERDLKSRALGLDADLVLVPAGAHGGAFDLARLAQDGQLTIVIVDVGQADLAPGGTAPVVASTGGETAAAEVAVRFAHQQGRAVELDETGGRRSRRPGTADRLLAVGMRVTAADGIDEERAQERASEGAIVVLGTGGSDTPAPLPPAGAGAVIRVLPVADDDGRTLDRLLTRYADPSAAPAEAAKPPDGDEA
jgi:Kef-type K+ transport system membrane component KefB